MLLSDNKYARFDVKFGGADNFRENLIVDADEFIGIKSFRAKGKRISNFTIDSIVELEPRIVEEPEEESDVAESSAESAP